MKASAKHFRVHAPHAHDTQTELKVFQSSALALNRIGNLEIPVKFPHSPILHYAFSSWIEKTMTKTIDCHWEKRFVLQ